MLRCERPSNGLFILRLRVLPGVSLLHAKRAMMTQGSVRTVSVVLSSWNLDSYFVLSQTVEIPLHVFC